MKLLNVIILSITLLISCGQTNTKQKETKKEVEKMTLIPDEIFADTLFSFEQYSENNIPEGWSQYYTGRGDGTKWEIINDNGNKVLAQLSMENPNYHFNEIVFDGFIAKNIILKVKMKGVDGKMDQGGGFVWRFIDKDNYYVVRANPLEDNIVLYKVENGKRSDLPLIGKGRTYGADVEALGNGWNNLKLKVENSLFTVYLNDKEIFQVKDETFKEEGKVGLWTKADAVSYFDEFEILLIP